MIPLVIRYPFMMRLERERPRLERERRARYGALGIGLGIALYGNAFSVVDAVAQLPLGGTVGGALLGATAVLVARRGAAEWAAELGLTRRGLGPSLLWGALLGLTMGLPGLLYFLVPSLVPIAVQHDDVALMTWPAYLSLVLLKIPFATALAEELAFRGLLQSRLREAGVARVDTRYYPGGRHEMLNETNRDEVTRDVIAWLDANLAR